MQTKTKFGIAAGVCSALIAGAAFGSADKKDDSLTLSLDRTKNPAVTAQTEVTTSGNGYNYESIGLSISFSAYPQKCTDDMLTFVFDDPLFTVYVPVESAYTCNEILNVSGIISEMEKDHIILADVMIKTETDFVSEEAQTTSPVPQSTPQQTLKDAAAQEIPPIIHEATVYVSSGGKYHRRSDCSGMKTYTEMTLSEATDSGYAPCKRCN